MISTFSTHLTVVKLSPNPILPTKTKKLDISDDHTFDTLHLSERIHNFHLQLVYYRASFLKDLFCEGFRYYVCTTITP